MIESRRRAYLDAMGFDIWSVKPPEPEPDRLVLQPGDGDTLLVCEGPDVTASRFAGDLARVLEGKTVWSWPDCEGRSDSPSLEGAVEQFLFTRVVFFGEKLVRNLFKGKVPAVVGSARIIIAPDIEELAVRGTAKFAFWNQLCGKSAADASKLV